MKFNQLLRITACSVIGLIATLSKPIKAQEKGKMDNARIVERLGSIPKGAEVVIDTDAFNEIDDQFALVYALLSPEAMNIQAIYAAPFINSRVKSEGEGMEKSYEEILRVLDRMHWEHGDLVMKGSARFMERGDKAVESEAAKDLVQRAMNASRPLYVLALGAPTNVASALIMEPRIREKIVVIWLGGKGLNWKTANEYNLMQDMIASRTLFESGVPLIQIPTEPVSSHLITTVPELEFYLGGKNKISDYLIEIFAAYSNDPYGWSKVIWDISVIAYMINQEWLQTELRPAPILTMEKTYSFDNSRHLYKVVTYINRDKVFKDMFKKLAAFKE